MALGTAKSPLATAPPPNWPVEGLLRSAGRTIRDSLDRRGWVAPIAVVRVAVPLLSHHPPRPRPSSSTHRYRGRHWSETLSLPCSANSIIGPHRGSPRFPEISRLTFK